MLSDTMHITSVMYILFQDESIYMDPRYEVFVLKHIRCCLLCVKIALLYIKIVILKTFFTIDRNRLTFCKYIPVRSPSLEMKR